MAALLSAPMPISANADTRAVNDGFYFSRFVQVSPLQGGRPSQRTEIRMAREGRDLRVLIRAFDDVPGEIVARQMRRDAAALLADDHVTVVLDVEGRGRNGYFFTVNANGAQYDGLIYDGGKERTDWDAYWYSNAHMEPDGWSAELVIPLSVLGVQRIGSAQTWRLNAERWIARNSERLRLAGAQPDKNVSSLGDALSVLAPSVESSGWGLRIKPSVRAASVSAGVTENRLQPAVEMFHQSASDVQTALALNIDFGEAEVDDRQINLTRFELFRAEKREFFLQQAGRFSFGGLDNRSPMPYYSRRIGLDASGVAHDLDGGLKLSGNMAGWDTGLLAARVSGEAETPGIPSQAAAEVGVVRTARQFTRESRVGFIGTAGNPDGTSGSHLWGVDYQYHDTVWRGDKTLSGNLWLQSSTNEGPGTAAAYGANIDFPNVGLTGNAAIQRIESGFLPALGFLAEDSVTRGDGELGWWHRTAGGTDIIPQLDWSFRETLDGRESASTLNPEIELENAAGDYFFPEIFFETERLAEPFDVVPGVDLAPGFHRWHSFGLYAGTSTTRPWSMDFEGSAGGYYDGHLNRQDVNVSWRPNQHWELSAGAGRTRLSVPAGSSTIRTGTLRLDASSSTALSGSALVQWDSVSQQLGISARVRWRWGVTREVFFAIDRLRYTQAQPRPEPGQSRALLKVVWSFER